MASLQFRDQPLPDKATKWNWDLPLMRDSSILNCSVIVNFPSGPKLTVAEIFLLKNSKRKLKAVLDILKSCWHINHVDFWYMQMNHIFSEVAIQRCSYKKCSENTQQIIREHPCRSAISINLQRNFIEIVLRHGRSPVNLLHISRTSFPKNTSGRLLLHCEFDENESVKKNL